MASTLNITLPEPLKVYVEAQTEAGNFGTPSQYISELILNDRDRRLGRLEDDLRSALAEQPISISQEEIERGNFVALFRQQMLAAQ
jgi:antitoxin ParD1/3/4